MNKTIFSALLVVFCASVFSVAAAQIPVSTNEQPSIGAFSVSLNVKDLKKSKAFYESLGFSAMGGGLDRNYLIMKNGNALIGIFQGMFDKTMLTFNPGWNDKAQEVNPFLDVRDIEKELTKKGIKTQVPEDTSPKGPAYIMLEDPDGNVILIDQHR